LGFFSPTPIQERALHAALREGKDVIGVAETGSGKTLAYGLPILQKLMNQRKKEARQGVESDRRLKALILAPTRELAVQVSDQLKLVAKHCSISVVPVIGGLAPQKQIRLLSKRPEIVVATPGRLWELINEGDNFLSDCTGLEFLVIDEADRMVETGHFSELKSIMTLVRHPANRELLALPSAAKVKNVLPPTKMEQENGEEGNDFPRKKVDGTEEDEDQENHEEEEEADEDEIKEEDEEDLEDEAEDEEQTTEVNEEDEDEHSIVDEAQVQLESEEDEEAEEEEDEEMNRESEAESEQSADSTKKADGAISRQTFIFSATLTITAQGRSKLGSKSKNDQSYKTGINALAQVSKLVGFQRPRKVIDLTTKKVMVSTLDEAVIHCLTEEKEYYLYYFAQKHPGRTLVFCNSISCIRRLVPILAMLNVPVWGLHASMQQRQRLKNLERFRNSKESLLIATDVAARGLDIPLVDHVIHYQLPRTAELYVHRSGRTARAAASGLSVMLVGPEDTKTYRQICSILRQGREVESFDVDRGLLPGVAKRVNLARKLDALTHEVRKKKTKKEWFKHAAEEMDIDIDDEILSEEDEDVKFHSVQKQKEIAGLKQQLAALLKRAILPKGGFTTFFTRSLFYDPNKLSQEVKKAALSTGPSSSGASKSRKGKSKAHRRKGRK